MSKTPDKAKNDAAINKKKAKAAAAAAEAGEDGEEKKKAKRKPKEGASDGEKKAKKPKKEGEPDKPKKPKKESEALKAPPAPDAKHLTLADGSIIIALYASKTGILKVHKVRAPSGSVIEYTEQGAVKSVA